MEVNTVKLLEVFRQVEKEYPNLIYSEAERFVVAIRSQKIVDADARILRNFQQLMTYVADKINLKEEEIPVFEQVVTLYYRPDNSNVIDGKFRKPGLRSKSRL